MTIFKHQKKSAFTLIELVVAVSIIGILTTISVIALYNARVKGRDLQRLSDAKQIQNALSMYFNASGRYPSAVDFNSGSITYNSPLSGSSTFLGVIPEAPTPPDGDCTDVDNSYNYVALSNNSLYSLEFCTANSLNGLPAGKLMALPSGIAPYVCQVDCVGKVCGDNGCGGSCGSCTSPFVCNNGACDCTPNCAGKNCGDNGCGSTCGTCSGEQSCVSGICQSNKFFVNVGGSGNQSSLVVRPTADGGYIAAGWTDGNGFDAYFVKLTASGSLDTSFGSGGTFTINSAGDQRIYALEPITGGGYIASGYTTAGPGGVDSYFIKLTANGSLDTSFGSGGIVTVGNGDQQFSAALQLATGGGYISAGSVYAGSDYDLYFNKLNANGSLDSSFGIGGSVTLSAGLYQRAYSVDNTSDGGYIASGYTGSGSGYYDGYIVKLNANGSLNTSFGTGGIVTIGGTGDQFIQSIRPISGGGYIGSGYSLNGSSIDILVIKLTANGSLDTSFGGTGKVMIGDTSYGQYGQSIYPLSGGGYIASGYTTANSNDAYIIKLTANGSLDTNFGSGGILTFGGAGAQSTPSIYPTADGGYVTSGSNAASNSGDVYIIKMNSYGSYQ